MLKHAEVMPRVLNTRVPFYYSSTHYFLFPVANFHFRFLAVNWRLFRLYGNFGLRDFIFATGNLEI